MGKRLMTLSDLYNYYSTQGMTQRFSCEGEGDTIVVQVDGKLNFSKDKSMDGLYPTRVQMNFVGDNLNGSRIQMKAQEAALSSSKYRPLLACIHDVDDEPQFYGHNMHQDENGEIVYDEQPVGVIAEEAHIEHDDEYDMDYAVAMGYIWEEYSKAAYIIERDGKCDVSVELSIRSLSYDAKDGVLVLDDFYYSGCTILGYDEDGNKVNPAMPGSNITLADFSAKNNSTVYSDKLLQAIEKLNTTLAKFEENSTRKEETTRMQDNELEMFEDETKKNLPDDDVVEEEENAPVVDDDNQEPEDSTPTTPTEPEEEDTQGDENPEEENGETFSLKCSIQNGENIKEFSVSMNAKIEALSTLVNDTYADDMTWYCVEVYDEEKSIIMIDCWTGKAYKQSYKVKDDVFSLKGDRVEVFSTWMTADEQKAFEKMKADFSELQTKFEEVDAKLFKYETETEKLDIINSEDYSQIADTDEVKAFAEMEAHFDMSVEEVKSHMDNMLLEFAKKGNLNFSVSENVKVKEIPTTPAKVGRYGNLFSK